MKKFLALLVAVFMVFGLFAGLVPATVKADGEADVPKDRYDATAEPRTGANAEKPLVMSIMKLDGKFSPFFYTSAYDNDVQSLTQVGLIHLDKNAVPVAGVEYPCVAYSFTEEVSEDESKTNYNFVLKKGLTFSDGEPITAKDVLFSIYVLCDPVFDGISNFYTNKIVGMQEYRLQTDSAQLEMIDKILEASIEPKEDGSFTINPAEGVSEEDSEKFWSYLDQAGEIFAKEIVDTVATKYAAHFASVMPGMDEKLLAEDDNVKTAFGMVLWGFGEVKDPNASEEDKDKDEEKAPEELVFVDPDGNEYPFKDMKENTLTPALYWNLIKKAYGGPDLGENGVNKEAAGETKVQDYLVKVYAENEAQVEGGVKSISGITTGTVVGEDGVEREFINMEAKGIDPTAIFRMGISVVPMHYYTEGYSGELNENGVDIGNREFMTHLKSKNDKPAGAGPYVFKDWKDSVVTFEANDLFMLGSPKIKTLRYQEIPAGGELDALKTGTVYFADPSAKNEIVNDITAGEGDYGKLSYILVDNDGYGYIAMQAQLFDNLLVRKALAHAMNVELAIDDYYGELASVNYRTMTKVQWAYPDNPEVLFPYDATGEKSKELFLEAGYKYDESANVMSYPEDHAKAGEQVTVKFTLPSEAKDHPAGSIAVDMKNVLEKIGVKMEIEVDPNLLGKLGTAYESGVEIWAAAWGSGGQDPDMFQLWYSDPEVNKADSPRGRGLTYLFTDGSDEQKDMLKELNELILAGRSTLDKEERREIYSRALDISSGLAIEIPTYQRKNMFVFNKSVIDPDTVLSGEDVTPFQGPLSFIWNVELLD